MFDGQLIVLFAIKQAFNTTNKFSKFRGLPYKQKNIRNKCRHNPKPNPFVPLECFGFIEPSQVTNQNNP